MSELKPHDISGSEEEILIVNPHLLGQLFSVILTSVADRHLFDADPRQNDADYRQNDAASTGSG
jgi:hypothetical protein